MERKKLDLLLNPRLTCWVGMVLILIGSNLWVFWTVWYQTNRTCDFNWMMEGRRSLVLTEEIVKTDRQSARLATLVDEIRSMFISLDGISGYRYSGCSRMSGPRHIGAVTFLIGVFLLTHGGIRTAFSRAGKTRGVSFQVAALLAAALAMLLATLCPRAIPDPTPKSRLLAREISANFALLVDLQKSDPSLVRVDVLERLRSSVADYVFARSEGTMPEDHACERAKDWLDSYGIPIPHISRDPHTRGGMQMEIRTLSEESLKALREGPAGEPAGPAAK